MKKKDNKKNSEPLERITVNQSKTNSLTINNGPIGNADNFNKFSREAQNRILTLVETEQKLKHEGNKKIIDNDNAMIEASRYRIKREANNIFIARIFPFFFVFIAAVLLIFLVQKGQITAGLSVFGLFGAAFAFMFNFKK